MLNLAVVATLALLLSNAVQPLTGIVAATAATRTGTAAQSAGLVSAIINRMERNRRDLRSLRASIRMEKYNSQLKDTENRYTGSVIYLPGKGRSASVRVDWKNPEPETITVTDGKYMAFRPRLNTAYLGNANSNRNRISNVLGFGLNVSRQELNSSFEPEYLGEETLWGSVRANHLKLIPRGNASYKHAEIWVDADGLLVQTRVVERNDDTTTVWLTDVRRNAPVAADEFQLRLASNVKKIPV